MRHFDRAIDDRSLWDWACNGDGAAFAAIFRRHEAAVLSQCVRQLADRSEAEDVTSIVFFEAWRLRRRVRFVDGSLRAWLLVVASNVSRNRRRAVQRYATLLAKLPRSQFEMVDVAESAVEAVEGERSRARVASAVAQLQAGERDVVLLCLASGLSYQESSDALAIPIGTVRSRLSRARAKLRTTLGDSDEPTISRANVRANARAITTEVTGEQ